MRMTMNEINTEFDNLSGLNDAKVFDQSHDSDPSIFDVPQAFQEFDTIEHEISRGEETLHEVSLFSDRLNHARVVRREDAIALESIVGELNSLPHIYSYTEDYSLVNYTITQESIFGKIKEVIGGILSAVWNFIITTLSSISAHIKSLFNKNKYSESPKAQKQAVFTQEKMHTKTAEAKAQQRRFSEAPPPRVDISKRTDRINKELRSLLYPQFSELTTLSRGGDISVDLLIKEMCEYRFKPFYTVFFDSMFNKDNVLLDYGNLNSNLMNNDLDTLAQSTSDFVGQDLTTPTATAYTIRYSQAPEQLKAYVQKFGATRLPQGNVADPSNEFKAYATIAYDVTRDITSIARLVDLPDPTVILHMDLQWLFDLDKVGNRILTSIDDNFKKLKKLKIDSDKTIDPSNRDNIKRLYNDWFVINKTMIISTMFVTRMNNIVKNYETLMNYIISVTAIINKD